MGEEEAHVRKQGKARLLTCGGVLLLLGAVIAGLLIACLDLPVQAQRQTDGSILSLLGYTTPDKPDLLTGPPLFRLLAPFLSDSQKQHLGVRRLRHTNGALTLWLKHSTESVKSPTAGFLGPFLFDHYVSVSDENGNSANQPFFVQHRWLSMDEVPGYRSLTMGVLPRRGKELTIRIYKQGRGRQSEPVAVFRTRNAFSGSHPVWPSQAVPVRQSAGEVEVELASLRTGLPYPVDSGLYDLGTWTQAELTVRAKGGLTDDWEPEQVWVRDATGNSWDGNAMVTRVGKGTFKAYIAGNLWEEPAWKLNFQIVKVNGFARENTCTLPALLPRKGIDRSRSEPAALGGMKVWTTMVIAKGSTLELTPRSPINGPQVLVQVAGENRDKLLRLVNVSGRRFRGGGNRQTGGTIGGRRRCYSLPNETPPGPVRLQFALNETRNVVFTVRPQPSSRQR